MSNINGTITLIVRNQNTIDNKTNELIQAINTTNFNLFLYTEAHEILKQIKLNLESLLNFLVEMENAITFTNLKIAHPSIICHQDQKGINY